MSRYFYLLILLSLSGNLLAQIPSGVPSKFQSQNNEKPEIRLYQCIGLRGDTTALDTTLGLHKLNKFNYLRRDDLELLPFANVGQSHNRLSLQRPAFSYVPSFAGGARRETQLNAADLNYYRVPTPLTELYFKTAFVQGQQLDAFFTTNVSEGLNISLAYKGVRSLGQYQHILTSTGDFRGTLFYESRDKHYQLKAHLVNQELLNQENGGLTESALLLYTTADPEFDDRGRLDVNFENAQNVIHSAGYFAHQEYLFHPEDQNSLLHSVGLETAHQAKSFLYTQKAAFEGFGQAYKEDNLYTKATGFNTRIKAYGHLNLPSGIKIIPYLSHISLRYGYDRLLDLNNGVIPSEISNRFFATGLELQGQWNTWQLDGSFSRGISSGKEFGHIDFGAQKSFGKSYSFGAKYERNSRPVAVNMRLNQSDYKAYNWFNDFGPVTTQSLEVQFHFPYVGSLKGNFTELENYTYFGLDENGAHPLPIQYDQKAQHLKIHHDKTWRLGPWGYQSEIIYQNVLNGAEVIPVPDLLTRQTLFFEDEWFKKAAKIQTGVRLKYFTVFNLPAYDPVLAEFYVQSAETLGAFPLVDFFFQTKIRQTRLFLIYEHMNQLFQGANNHFSAPGIPYRDASLRFGLVWNFFK